MIKVAFLHFTPDEAMAVADQLTKTPPPPEYIKIQGPLVKGNIEEGISTMSIFEFEDDRGEEASGYLEMRYSGFKAISGVEVVIEEWMDSNLALQLLEEGDSVAEVLEMVSLNLG